MHQLSGNTLYLPIQHSQVPPPLLLFRYPDGKWVPCSNINVYDFALVVPSSSSLWGEPFIGNLFSLWQQCYFLPNKIDWAQITRSNPLTMHTDKSTLLNADCGGLERRLSIFAPQENHRMSSVDHNTYIDEGEGSPKCDEPSNYQSCNGGLVIGLLPLQSNTKLSGRCPWTRTAAGIKQATNNHASKQKVVVPELHLYFKLFGTF